MPKGRPPGQPKTGGRQKGTPNKINAPLKEMILGALSAVGGTDYLAKQALDNPASFLALIGKVLPTTLAASGEGLTKLVIEWQQPPDDAA
jgi:hypothetical protein